MIEEIAQPGYNAKLNSDFLKLCDCLAIEIVSPQPPSLEALAIERRPEYKGHISSAYQFRVTSPVPVHDLLCRFDLAQRGFFRLFFDHPEVRKAIPAIGELVSENPDCGFKNSSAFMSFGWMASQARSSPCYPLPRPRRIQTDPQAIQAAIDFFDAVCDGELSKTWAWCSDEEWCWAVGGIDRYSYVWIYPDNQLITVYLYSDSS